MIGVVTVLFNSEPVLPEFLDSLSRLDLPVRIYAVDNASRDRSIELIEAATDLDTVVLAQHDNLGIAVGNNVGIRRALEDRCDQVVLLNNDTTFEPDLIRRLIETADAEQADIVVPSIRYHERPDLVWFEAARFDDWRGSVPVSLPPAPPGSITRIECANTCCALIRPSVFAGVGMMDESYFVYWDDTDFFFRCRAAGVEMVLDAGAVLLHKVSVLTGGAESDFSQRERIKNRVYYIRKHHRRFRRWVGLALTAANACKLVLRDEAKRRRAGLLARAVVDGMRIPLPTASTS